MILGSSALSLAGRGFVNAFEMAYEVWWALVLGFAISAIVQAWVPRERIEAALSGDGARPVGIATLLGAPTVAVVAAWVLLPRVIESVFPGITEQHIVQFLNRPATPLILALALIAIISAAGSIAFTAATHGFANYRHSPERR